MKVWGLILGVAIIFGSVMNSEDAFAWKDKSKTSSDRDSSKACSSRCNDLLNSATQRCAYIWNDGRGESTRRTNRCEEYATVNAQNCERNCQERH
jgi:hypothetical protein